MKKITEGEATQLFGSHPAHSVVMMKLDGREKARKDTKRSIAGYGVTLEKNSRRAAPENP